MGHGCLSVDGLFYNYKPFWGYYEPTSIPWDGTRVFVFHGSLGRELHPDSTLGRIYLAEL